MLWPLIGLLVLAPLPLGSNRPLPWTLLALAVGLLLVGWSVAAALRPARDMGSPERLGPAILGLGIVVLVALVQILPATPRAWHHPLWLRAAGVLGPEVVGRVSVDPYETGTALMRLLAYAGVFWLALQLSQAPHGARRIVQAIAFAGLAYAAYGLAVFWLETDTLLWWRRWAEMPGITSSFVNRNSYATYAGLGLLCAAGLLITTVYRDVRSRRFRRQPWRVRLLKVTWWGWWLVGAAFTLAFALVLTGSRAGVASSAVALAGLVASFGATRLMRARDVRIVGIVALGLAALVFAFGGDDLAERLEQRGLDSPRWAAYPPMVGALGDAPWLGTGYGTFPEVFRAYQGGRPGELFWNHAHNTYLENALELGVPAAAALVGALGWLARVAARRLHRRRATALYPCLGVAATILVGLHSLLDFSLEIPAIAVTYAALLGVAVGRSHGPARPSRRRRRAARHPLRHRLGPALGVLVAAGILALAVPRLAAQLIGLPAQLVERQLEAHVVPPPGRLDRAVVAGAAAAAWADPGVNWWRVGRAELALAQQPGLLANAQRSRLERADQALRRSLAHAPANPAAWAQLAQVNLLRHGDPALIGDALTLSVLTGPSQGGVMPLRATIAILAWPRLRPSARAALKPQLVKTMAFAPQPLVEAIRRTAGVDVLRAELEDTPRLRAELERRLLILGAR